MDPVLKILGGTSKDRDIRGEEIDALYEDLRYAERIRDKSSAIRIRNRIHGLL